MNADIKHSWLNALRSGAYEQAKGFLRKCNGADSFCCLGVLQDIIAPERWTQDDNGDWGVMDDPDDDYDSGNNGHFSEGELAYSFQCHVGLSPDACSHLATMNDGLMSNGDIHARRYSFNEIADYIEEHH
jgi:hypothetical protein